MDWPFILLYRRYLPLAEETFNNRFVSYLTEQQLLYRTGSLAPTISTLESANYEPFCCLPIQSQT
jgi:hypothetical protein